MGHNSPSIAVNPLIVTTSDVNGGAARAAYRLHQGLLSLDVASQMLVHRKMSGDGAVFADASLASKMAPLMNRLPLKFYRDRQKGLFSTQWFPSGIEKGIARLHPQIVSLHWIGNGYVQLEALSRCHSPLVWTLHDFWALTGGCHYPSSCDRYQEKCGYCPHLHSQQQWDVSHWVWQRKARIYPNLNLTLVAPTQWLANAVRRSSLGQNLPVEVIPHGLNTNIYQPIDRQIARNILNLPPDKHLVLFAADSGSFLDPRKGLHLLCDALKMLALSHPEPPLEAVFLGLGSPLPQDALPPSCKAHYLGQLYDDVTLALAYSAADVTVVPSTQEVFGQIASESLACGTPVVAFQETGVSEIVEHQKNGYLASYMSVTDLAAGISWLLADRDRYLRLRSLARATAVEKFSLQLQAQRYLSLFQKILAAVPPIGKNIR